jgi:plasmid replication initiation protein
MDEVLHMRAGRSSERPAGFADVILYRGRAGDGADCLTTFDKETVMLSRPVGGLACKVRLSTRQYKAVALIARGERHTICLLHGEKGLSVELTDFDEAEAAEQYCLRLAAFLDLPMLLMARGGGNVSDRPAASPRRRMRARRPRFLTRRKSGDVIEFRKFSGREIIARS